MGDPYNAVLIPIFLEAAKNRAADPTFNNNIMDMAHRRDSIPRDGSSKSLMMPTTNGPNPKPKRFNIKNTMAELSARMDAETRLWATVIKGPRYMLC